MTALVSKDKLDYLVDVICKEVGLFARLHALRNSTDFYKYARKEIFNCCKAIMCGRWSSTNRDQTSYIVHKVLCRCFGRAIADEILENIAAPWILSGVKEYLEPINELDGLYSQGGTTTGRVSSRDISKKETYAALYGMGDIRLAELTQNLNKGEINMAANIEVKTFVKGTDAANLSDDQIFSVILSIEQEIEGLEKIQNKPETLKDKIKAMMIDVDALVKYVDNRAKK